MHRFWKLAKQPCVDLLLIVAGCVLMALAVDVFLDPNDVVPGGFTALAIFANRLWSWPIGLTLLVLNLPFVLLGMRVLGAQFGSRTLLAVALVSLAIDFLRPLVPQVQGEPLLYTIYGGLLFGLGQGLVFRARATSGGTETPARLLHRLRGIRMSQSLLVMDLIILAGAVSFFGLAPALYALIAVWVMTRVVGFMEAGSNDSDSVFVVTSEADVIRAAILEKLERGVTLLSAEGGYTGSPRLMLFTVVSRREVGLLRQIVSHADPQAFMVINPSNEVLGEGFRALRRPGRRRSRA